eukprot:CAMPEP_0198282412 /NCGR_PEP_ID=MMETSP1449-20131203/2243_1 /TAXON_ID=420275 /ORGANISM="Attheya septentrionalis, Strain CCMP2084" /LENGTH=576 /DNA_ID=CAMNT_0043978667 /DNA_START=212 /DNA_END=1942 /DNA_ORIENTATION=+
MTRSRLFGSLKWTKNATNEAVGNRCFRACLRRPLFSRLSYTIPKTSFPSMELQYQWNSSLAPSSDTDDDHYLYDPVVVENGTAVAITFPSHNSTDESIVSIYHAPWLWSNDPTFVVPSAGQKLRSPGDYRGSTIQSVSIVTAVEAVEGNDPGSEIVIPVPPPLQGSAHPVASMYHSFQESQIQPPSEDQLILKIIWNPETDIERTTPHVSYYDMNWMECWRYDDQALHKRRNRTEVTKFNAIRAIGPDGNDTIEGVDYMRLLASIDGDNDTDELFHLLHALFRDGAVIIKDAPKITSGPFAPASVVGHAIGGSLSHGNLYGEVFHVRSQPNTNNVANTNKALRPHQDLAYYESMPGIQLLHCIDVSPNQEGGDSTLIDCMAAAHELRRIAPHHFWTLVTCPATFVKQRDGANMTYIRPHIVLKGGADMNDLNREIVQVNWSPPFEGPLCLQPHQVVPYYEAYAAFEQMINTMLEPNQRDPSISKYTDFAREYTWKRRLEPGELLVFNNRRMLHGRTAFSYNTDPSGAVAKHSQDRHLFGCYTNIDDTLNRYRVLFSKQNGLPSSILNVSNGTTIVP